MRASTRLLLPLFLTLTAGTVAAQNTVPHWSTYFGGSGSEEGVVVRHGPGNLVTVVGHTTIAGNTDAFVARFDPALPPGAQLVWSTTLGGSGMELVFDAEVDPLTGTTTLVGLSQSTNFPAPPGQASPLLNGPSDGFLAQLNPFGGLQFSTFFGGSADDRICEVEVDNSGIVTIAGVTESTNLHPLASGTLRGATDAFVARLVPINPPVVLGAVYVGGGSTEGMPFASWPGLGAMWEGNLDRMALTLDQNGDAVLATASFQSPTLPQLTAGIQLTYSGNGDIYLAVLNQTNATLPYGFTNYGTLYGGSLDERPKDIAVHPAGGFVIGGITFSSNLLVTLGCFQPLPAGGGDGFLARIDPHVPGPAGLRYATYFGGNAGQDNVLALAVETSGLVTLAGLTAGGSFPVTPRCLQPTAGAAQSFGMVARLALTSQGPNDLLYSSLVCPPGFVLTSTYLTSIVLDEVGDAFFAGTTNSVQYPTTANAPQPAPGGGNDAVITHLPLLPGGIPGICVTRQQLALAMPACGTPLAPLYTGMAGAPVPGTTFGITATNAPPVALGALLLGTPVIAPGPPLPWLLVSPGATIFLLSDPLGFTRHDIPIPAALPPVLCWGLSAQWLFLTNAACPGTGFLATSERLDF